MSDCKTCKFYNEHPMKNTKEITGSEKFGICKQVAGQSADKCYVHQKAAVMIVGENFGCIHHYSKHIVYS